MGIYEKPSAKFLESLKSVFNFEPPREHGFDTVESIRAMASGKVKVFLAMGGNFLSATPDTDFTGKALEKCDLTVHISTKLNRSHLVHGKVALILPCLGRTEIDIQERAEQFVSVENSTGVVHKSQGGKKPTSEHLLSEPKIVTELAKATLSPDFQNIRVPAFSSVQPKSPDALGNAVVPIGFWDMLISNYDNIRSLIEKTIPGFEKYNDRVRKDGGFYLPNGARQGEFKTSTAKANFTINTLADHILKPNEYLMMTVRSHDQYNTTIYGMHDRYRGIYNGRRVVFINEHDALQAGLKKGDVVDIISKYDGVERKAEDFVIVPYEIPKQNIATYFPEANPVIPYNHFARGSQTPISKSVVVQLRRKS
jgi:anaerobic selenocysteine-containing dehydrogenase